MFIFDFYTANLGSLEVSSVRRLWIFVCEIPVRPTRRLGAEHDPGVVLLECFHNLFLAVEEVKVDDSLILSSACRKKGAVVGAINDI